jgi:hypothetical protein
VLGNRSLCALKFRHTFDVVTTLILFLCLTAAGEQVVGVTPVAEGVLANPPAVQRGTTYLRTLNCRTGVAFFAARPQLLCIAA